MTTSPNLTERRSGPEWEEDGGYSRGKYIRWNEDILPSIRRYLNEASRDRIVPTVRGILYILESLDCLQKKDYKNLSKHLVNWRETGQLPINCVADKTRHIIGINQYVTKGARIVADFDESLQTWADHITPSQHIESAIEYLSDTAEDLYSYVPRWLGQPRYVEVFIEKNAMSSAFNSVINKGDNPRMVIIVPNGGWSSHTFVMNNIERLRYQKRKGRDVYVQYYGDSDPTGERMTASNSKLVRKLRGYGINFERVAIDEKTIRDFCLEDIRDKDLDIDTLRKLRNNPNHNWFLEQHEGQLWQIELDALLLNISKFKEFVLTNIDKHFDTIQNEAIERFKELYPESAIRQQLIDRVESFLENYRWTA